MLKVIRVHFGHFRWFHCSSTLGKRHSRPGMTSEVGLKELLVDKPPNYYQNIEQKLEKINYYDNPINIKNIGLDKEDKQYQNFFGQTENIIKIDTENNDKNLILDDEELKFLSKEDYEKLSNYWLFTKQYINSKIQLAHHYGIFRDLFFEKPFQNETCGDLIVSNAKNEVKFYKLKHPEIYYFTPLVPIHAEFIKQNQNEEEASVLKSFQGNLIPAEYGAQVPIININTSGINNNLNISVSPSSEALVTLNSGQNQDNNYYTLVLVNLDSHFSDSGVCHWILSNIHRNGTETNYETLVKYLPIYAMRGFGYHRYVFVLFQHDKKLVNFQSIQDYDLGKRKFNGLEFISHSTKNEISMNPIGLSWFQTTWSDYCKDIFHNILEMRCPTYEYIFPKQTSKFKQLQFPIRNPFNLYLDAFRNPKDLSKEVLLERLKSIDAFESYDTEKMYPSWEGRPKFPHIYPFPRGTPDWLKSTLMRKRSHVGRFRGLRASSAILPYNNNADLDNPMWPRIHPDVTPLNLPNTYPDGKRRPKPLKETKWVKPLTEHHSLRVDYPDVLEDEDKIQYDKTPVI